MSGPRVRQCPDPDCDRVFLREEALKGHLATDTCDGHDYYNGL